MAIFRRSGDVAAILMVTLWGIMARAAPVSVDAIPVSEDYFLRTWEADDGLPNNRVLSIAQTPDGYLWIATGGGLARFDGMRFTRFLQDANSGLESNQVRAVFAARDGALWIGLDRGGVARMSGGRFETIVPCAPGTARATTRTSIAQDADGAMWFGFYPDQKILRWRNGTLSTFSSAEGVGPGAGPFVQADASGKVWFATEEGCGVFDGKRFQPVDPIGGLRPVITPARDGGIWAMRRGRILCYHADGSVETVADFGSSPDLGVSVLYEDYAGDLWIGTSNAGLFRFRDGNLIRVPTSHTYVSTIMEDREGNLWVGTTGGGLNRLRPCRFFLRQERHGLLTDGVVSLCDDAEGRLWLAGSDGAPVRALDSSNRLFAPPAGYSRGTIEALVRGPEGEICLGSLGGLTLWKDGVFSPEPFWSPLTAILPDRQGGLWLATINEGLVRWRNGNAEQIPKQDGLVEPRALAEDAVGRVWVGTEDGLVFQRRDDRFVPVPLAGSKPGDQIRFIVPDQLDVWIGAFDGGLYRWRSGQVARLPHEAGLPVDDLRVLEIAPSGDFWIGTGQGMFRIARSELDAAIDGKEQAMRLIAYGRNDGLPSADFMDGFKNTATRTHDGHLWFATTRGALEIIPQDFQNNAPPLSALIEEVQAGGASMPGAGTGSLTLPPSPGPLQIRYTLPELSSPEQVVFRYRLVGWGDDWILADRQRTAVFTHLPPGNYRFEVAAAEAGGPWLPAASSLDIRVQAAWWETPLFRVSAAIAGMLASVWLVRTIMKRRFLARMQRIEQEHALERERARIARDMHDELGASLTQISIASELAKLDPAEAMSSHIDDISAIARHTVTALDEIVWAINSRNDTLPALFEYLGQYAIDFLASAGIACELEIPAELPARPMAAQTRHHLFLAVKEALNNIVKHAGATEVRLKVELAAGELRIIVADNGRGIGEGRQRAGSDGLGNMRERMEEAGGKCTVESHPGEGTRILFEMPLANAARIKAPAR